MHGQHERNFLGAMKEFLHTFRKCDKVFAYYEDNADTFDRDT